MFFEIAKRSIWGIDGGVVDQPNRQGHNMISES